MKITENVYVETGFRGSNVSYVTTSDGIVMIDSPHRPSDGVKWQKEMESRGRIAYLINTEWHVDHVASNCLFEVPVIASEKTREDILAVDPAQFLEGIAKADPEGVAIIKGRDLNAPSITFSERLTLFLGAHSFRMTCLPGHTEGQSVVYVPEARVLFTGDNVFGRVQTFLHYAHPFAWLESLDKISEFDADYIVPGHGQVVDKSYIADQADYIRQCIDTVQAAIDRGWNEEEVQARVTLPQKYPLEKGLEQVGEFLCRLSVTRLYNVLSDRK